MSIVSHLINNPDYHNFTFVITPIVKKSVSGILLNDISYDNYKKIISMLDDNKDENNNCIKTAQTNRVFRYRDLVMVITGDKNHREYYQEKQYHVEIKDNFLITVLKKVPIEKQEFPMINKYDAEYTEDLIVYRKTPITVSLNKNNKYSVKITFELRPLREKYIDSKLDQIIKMINP